MTPKKQVSPAIRILRGERDASARATHLEAATRKFLVTTNERKQMSTKTNFKRIALVAVAALGLGLLSSTPSQALIIGTPTVTVTNGTATVGNSDSVGAATIAVRYFAEGASDTASITVSMGIKPSGAVGGTDSILVTAADTATSTGLTLLKGNGALGTAFAIPFGTDSVTVGSSGLQGGAIIPGSGSTFAAGKFSYFLDTALVRTVGTYTLNYVVSFYEAATKKTTVTQAGTFTIVVSNGTDAAAAAVASSATSTAIMYGSASGTTNAAWQAPVNNVDSSVSVPSTPDGTVRSVIRVTLKTAAGLPASESITVTTSVGNIGSSQSVSGKSLVLVGEADGVQDINLYSDGNGGTAVITIKSTSVTFANKAATFYGTEIATIAVTTLATTIGGTSTNTLVATAKDAGGVNVRTANGVYVYSSDLNVINTGTAPDGTSCGSYNSTYGGYVCAVSGANNGTATLTVRNKSTSTLSTVASAATTVKVNTASPASFTLAFDKATYAPGEAAYIVIKPLDAAKAAVGGANFANLFATGGITSATAFGNGSVTTDTLSAVSITTAGKVAAIDGIASQEAVAVYKVYMPASGGTVTITAKGGASLPSSGQVNVTATATVTDNAAAALAAVTALATTVASLKTLITTLTNLVLKIQKKVKA